VIMGEFNWTSSTILIFALGIWGGILKLCWMLLTVAP